MPRAQRSSDFPNFSRDSRDISRVIATLIGGLSAIAFMASGYLAWAAHDLSAKSDANDALKERMVAKVLALRSQIDAAPKPEDIATLRQQIARLDAADDGRGLDIDELLDVLEARLPGNVRITNLDYDRSKGLADVVAVSASSQDLTGFFDSLDHEAKFVGVRLVDKMQVHSSSGAEIQVHLLFGAPKRSSGKRGPAS